MLKKTGGIWFWRFGRVGGSFYRKRRVITLRQDSNGVYSLGNRFWDYFGIAMIGVICILLPAAITLSAEYQARESAMQRSFLSTQLRAVDYEAIAEMRLDPMFRQCLEWRGTRYPSGIYEMACHSNFAGFRVWEQTK